MTRPAANNLQIYPIGPCALPLARAVLQLRLAPNVPRRAVWLAGDAGTERGLRGAAVLQWGVEPRQHGVSAWVATAPWNRREGVGAALLEHVIAAAREMGAGWMRTWKMIGEDEVAAARLVAGRGFGVRRTLAQYETTAAASYAYTSRQVEWLRRRGTIPADIRHVTGHDAPVARIAALMLETFGPDAYALVTRLGEEGFGENWVLHGLMQGDVLVAGALVHVKGDTSRLDYLAVEPTYRARDERRFSWAHLLLKNEMGAYELRHPRPLTRFSADDDMSDTGKYAQRVGGRVVKREHEYQLTLRPEDAS